MGLLPLASVAEKLKSHVDEQWSQEVLSQIRRNCSTYDSLGEDERFEMYLDYILHTDIRHYWKGGSGAKKQPWFVQIEQVQDISQPIKSRLTESNSKKRMLKLVLFDGKNHHSAIEHQALPFAWPKLGSKLMLDEAVILQAGVFLLTPSTCGYLGGKVEEFEKSQSTLKKVLQEPMYGRRGPPLQLEEYMKMLKEKVSSQTQGHGHQEPDQQDNGPNPVEEYVIDSDSDANLDIDEIVRQKRSSREMDEVIILDEAHDTNGPVQDSLAETFEALKRRRAMRQSGT